MDKKKIDVSKKAFVAWVKNPSTKKKHKFKLSGESIRASRSLNCPLQAWGKDLGLRGGKYATEVAFGMSKENQAHKLKNDVIDAADIATWDLNKDSQERRLRTLMLKSFGLKETKEAF